MLFATSLICAGTLLAGITIASANPGPTAADPTAVPKPRPEVPAVAETPAPPSVPAAPTAPATSSATSSTTSSATSSGPAAPSATGLPTAAEDPAIRAATVPKAETVPATAPAVPISAGSKKARWLHAKRNAAPASDRDRDRWRAELDRRIGKPPASVINIYSLWTREFLSLVEADEIADKRADQFFRCHFTNVPTAMDPRLLDALVAAANHFGVYRIDIVSGFRAPKFNLMLRKKGREVARRSQHSRGAAVDFRLPGVPVGRLRAWAQRLGLGGVGFYPTSGFIHLDTGPVRQWRGR